MGSPKNPEMLIKVRSTSKDKSSMRYQIKNLKSSMHSARPTSPSVDFEEDRRLKSGTPQHDFELSGSEEMKNLRVPISGERKKESMLANLLKRTD